MVQVQVKIPLSLIVINNCCPRQLLSYGGWWMWTHQSFIFVENPNCPTRIDSQGRNYINVSFFDWNFSGRCSVDKNMCQNVMLQNKRIKIFISFIVCLSTVPRKIETRLTKYRYVFILLLAKRVIVLFCQFNCATCLSIAKNKRLNLKWK